MQVVCSTTFCLIMSCIFESHGFHKLDCSREESLLRFLQFSLTLGSWRALLPSGYIRSEPFYAYHEMLAVCSSMSGWAAVILVFTSLLFNTNAFRLSPVERAYQSSRSYYSREIRLFENRREFLEYAPTSFISLFVVTTTSFGSIQVAEASGGATAGGAYLLSVCVIRSLSLVWYLCVSFIEKLLYLCFISKLLPISL
jgi:hypothetical protein